MKKNNLLVLCVLLVLWAVSCATTQPQEAGEDVSAELTQEDADVKALAESFKDLPQTRPENGLQAGAASAEPVSGAYHTDYHEFGPNKVPLIVSVPNNTDQEINAIIWLCDESTLGSSVFDFGVYPAEYKGKYIIAVMPYKFESGDVRVRNIKDSVGNIVDFVKTIADEHEIDINRIILVGYTIGSFSMAYL
ncbi:MAG: hypothetical protein LBB98_15355 [Treponema sp.]|jgi:hypothetical protein|nr:hypothetical protein [Treponema sp.]